MEKRETDSFPGIGQRKPVEGKSFGEANGVLKSRYPYDTTYMWNLKYDRNNLSTKQKQTHRHREQTCGCQRGQGEGRTGNLGLTDISYYI